MSTCRTQAREIRRETRETFPSFPSAKSTLVRSNQTSDRQTEKKRPRYDKSNRFAPFRMCSTCVVVVPERGKLDGKLGKVSRVSRRLSRHWSARSRGRTTKQKK